MGTPPIKLPTSKIKQIEEDITELKAKLEKPHLTKSDEQDYDIKSQIIDKQNEMIEILIELANKNTTKKGGE